MSDKQMFEIRTFFWLILSVIAYTADRVGASYIALGMTFLCAIAGMLASDEVKR